MASYVLPICLLVTVLTVVFTAPADDESVQCPPNELYYKCQLEMCFKTCAHLKEPPPCPSIHPDCYDPACLCNYGDLRNSTGQCVPEDKCS
ncbi:hypothetical protein PYW07_016659 [Mythimna separata]|uniref:TIL domain-containing protein n=1 Tax=Mythimna separata TaxID=271217 RepID=A0AAD8DT49_MYTSE|nr:hypothetical protein PYW07_016659 [Mythimna separata]